MVVVWLCWGSSFPAIRVMVKTLPPLLASGTIFVVAAVALATTNRRALRAAPSPGHHPLRHHRRHHRLHPPPWLAWGIGVGVSSSVIPYVTDQLAMARLPRTTFALMLALLPATATAIGLLLLHRVPTGQDLLGIGLVIAGIALHHDRPPRAAVADPSTPRVVSPALLKDRP